MKGVIKVCIRCGHEVWCDPVISACSEDEEDYRAAMRETLDADDPRIARLPGEVFDPIDPGGTTSLCVGCGEDLSARFSRPDGCSRMTLARVVERFVAASHEEFTMREAPEVKEVFPGLDLHAVGTAPLRRRLGRELGAAIARIGHPVCFIDQWPRDDGRYFLVVSLDPATGDACWSSWSPMAVAGRTELVNAYEYAPDGSPLATARDRQWGARHRR